MEGCRYYIRHVFPAQGIKDFGISHLNKIGEYITDTRGGIMVGGDSFDWFNDDDNPIYNMDHSIFYSAYTIPRDGLTIVVSGKTTRSDIAGLTLDSAKMNVGSEYPSKVEEFVKSCLEYLKKD